jgi:hypothetical protein
MPGKRITDHQMHKYKQHRNKLSQAVSAAKAVICERSTRRIEDAQSLSSQRPEREACKIMVGLLVLAADGHEAQLAHELELLLFCCGYSQQSLRGIAMRRLRPGTLPIPQQLKGAR